MLIYALNVCAYTFMYMHIYKYFKTLCVLAQLRGFFLLLSLWLQPEAGASQGGFAVPDLARVKGALESWRTFPSPISGNEVQLTSESWDV